MPPACEDCSFSIHHRTQEVATARAARRRKRSTTASVASANEISLELLDNNCYCATVGSVSDSNTHNNYFAGRMRSSSSSAAACRARRSDRTTKAMTIGLLSICSAVLTRTVRASLSGNAFTGTNNRNNIKSAAFAWSHYVSPSQTHHKRYSTTIANRHVNSNGLVTKNIVRWTNSNPAFGVCPIHNNAFGDTALTAKRGIGGGPSKLEGASISNTNTNTPKIMSIPYEQDVEQTLAASGYKRPTVNWYPGHIAKAERQLSETLKSVDVVVEVRDARAPKATAHPRVAEWAAGRPRVVVLTHVDSVPEVARASWKKSYDVLGAGRWDGDVDGQIRNKAVQGMAERSKYSGGSSGTGTGTGTDNTDNTHKTSNRNDQGGRQMDRSAVSRVEDVLFVDAKRGGGIHSINRAVLRAGAHVNERRARRGLSSRPLRVGIIGYPNVGKSALINKILGRKRARTANTPGVTRSLQWIRVRTDDAKKNRGKEFELLDSPGIIPANMVDQSDALLLAACNSIGTAAYDNQAVAAYLMEWLKTLHLMGRGDDSAPQWREACKNRYGFDPLSQAGGGDRDGGGDDGRLLTGEDMLFRVADAKCRGSPEDAARKILQDFRTGRMGPISLQLAPQTSDDDGQVKVDVRRGVAALGGVGEEMTMAAEEREKLAAEQREERARMAVETAKERGLELPPMVEKKATGETSDVAIDDSSENVEMNQEEVSESPVPKEDEIGKGLFDGW